MLLFRARKQADAIGLDANSTRRTGARLCFGPLCLGTRTVCSCWSMPASTRIPCSMCVSIVAELLRLCLMLRFASHLWCILSMHYFMFLHFLALLIVLPCRRVFYLLFISTCLSLCHLIFHLECPWAGSLRACAAVIPTHSADRRRWLLPSAIIALTVRGFWSMPGPTWISWIMCVSIFVFHYNSSAVFIFYFRRPHRYAWSFCVHIHDDLLLMSISSILSCFCLFVL